VTFTVSKLPHPINLVFLAFLVAFGAALTSCDQPAAQPPVKNRVPTISTQAEPQEPPSLPPNTAGTAPAGNTDEKPQKDAPFYGSTYWDELLTSVYYYPVDPDVKGDVAETHLKFNHREDDIWLCGDQRRFFEAGNRIKLVVTFEPNQPCATNWKTK
jgi:hypothetical protein